MKLYSIDRSSAGNTSFSAGKNSYPHFLKIWHYHPELELVYILKSSGTRFIGDSIEKFQKGDLILIGKDLPHMWLNDEVYFKENSKRKAEAIAIHFKPNFLGDTFLNLPEIKNIHQLLKNANCGIHFINVSKKIRDEIEAIPVKKGIDKMLSFISILNKLANHKEKKHIASTSFVENFNDNNHEILSKVYEHIFNNFNKPITLIEIAKIANMNPSAFSRYFKRINRKTLTRYINEIRIGYACKKLMENKLSVTQICFESGYNSISNFNKQFKAITNLTPSEYVRKTHKID